MLIMDGDLVLVGSSPSTFRGYSPAPPSCRSQTYSTSSSRINSFFDQNGRNQSSPSPAKSNTKNIKKQRTHKPSYVDEMLFGQKPTERDQPSPWEESSGQSKHQTYVFGEMGGSTYSPEKYTTPKRQQTAKGSSTDRPPSGYKSSSASKISHSRPSSARSVARTHSAASSSASRGLKRPPKLFKHTESYVDDLLFGAKGAEPDFDSPWKEKKKQPNAFNFDYTNYKTNGTGEQASHRTVSPSSKQGSAGPARPQSGCKIRHSSSYVDETLFGPKPVEPEWEAPWSDPKEKLKNVNIYDAFNHKVTIEHGDVEVVRPKGLVAMQKKKPPSSAKPVWR